jgi:anthranilate synthase component I
MFEPSFEAFAKTYDAGEAALVSTRLVGDLETPVSAFLKLSAQRKAGLFLLESVEGGAARGRYSMIGLDPDIIWRCRGERAEINRQALSEPDAFAPCPAPPLDALRALIAESRIAVSEDMPPMAAGVFGYLGYDMVRQMEKLAPAKPDPIGVPDAIMLRPTVMVVFDSVKDEIWVVTPVRPRAGTPGRAAHESALERIEAVVAVLEGSLAHDPAGFDPHLGTTAPKSNTTAARFHAMVERAKEYIRAGDVFQVVLSQRFTAPFALPAISLYRALRRVNPAPFLCYLDFGRNDVGRVAEIGTVTVTEKFAIERYSHVMHIVSNVEGTLARTSDDIDALCAGFPAGTVSGAPKVRAMEIIDELETDKRGIYAGCIGYFGANGEMDTCIVLRTSIVKDGFMHVQAGAGIVYDSDPAYEQRECANKAQALFRAAEEAVKFAARTKKGQ